MAASDATNGPRRVTISMLQVLGVLLSDPTRKDWFAMQICRTTHLGSGTVVQVLFRLEHWGWVESTWEDMDEARDKGRPRRKFYRLTGTGARSAKQLIERKFQGQLRWRMA